MDVKMPKGDGFALLPKLKPLPAIIFVTACDEFAVKAFEVDAVDYLLKPVRPERLANALQRVVHSQKPSQAERLSYDDKILLDADEEMRVVFVAEISGITAEGNYTRVQLADGSSSFVRRGITQWDLMLPKAFFLRVERSLIIHLRPSGKSSRKTATKFPSRLKDSKSRSNSAVEAPSACGVPCENHRSSEVPRQGGPHTAAQLLD